MPLACMVAGSSGRAACSHCGGQERTSASNERMPLASIGAGRRSRRLNLSTGCLQALLLAGQHIEVAHCQLVGIEGLQASGALCAGCPSLHHIEGALCKLVSDEGLRASGALCAGCPGWQHIEVRIASWSALKAVGDCVH